MTGDQLITLLLFTNDLMKIRQKDLIDTWLNAPTDNNGGVAGEDKVRERLAQLKDQAATLADQLDHNGAHNQADDVRRHWRLNPDN